MGGGNRHRELGNNDAGGLPVGTGVENMVDIRRHTRGSVWGVKDVTVVRVVVTAYVVMECAWACDRSELEIKEGEIGTQERYR